MQLLKVNLEDDHNIFHFGDEHEGSSLFYRTGWNKLITAMQGEYMGCSNNYGIHGGDYMEAITVDDKRFSVVDDEEEKVPLPLRQQEQAIKRLEPIADKILFMLDSNHPRSLWRFGPLTKMLCERLKIPYGTYTAKISVMDESGNLMYKIFETHGRKMITSIADDPIRRTANQKLILKRHLRDKAGDCAIMVKHHVHKLIVSAPEKVLFMTDDGKRIKQNYTRAGQRERYIYPDLRWYGCAGSFVRLYGDGTSGYAEIAEYDPVELGFLVTRVRDRQIIALDAYYL